MSYRDRVYIVSDIILKLIEYGKMNQTAVTTFCGLNISKHRSILDKMEHNGLIERTEESWEEINYYLPMYSQGSRVLQEHSRTVRENVS